jgi:hypothetical protein
VTAISLDITLISAVQTYWIEQRSGITDFGKYFPKIGQINQDSGRKQSFRNQLQLERIKDVPLNRPEKGEISPLFGDGNELCILYIWPTNP